MVRSWPTCGSGLRPDQLADEGGDGPAAAVGFVLVGQGVPRECSNPARPQYGRSAESKRPPGRWCVIIWRMPGRSSASSHIFAGQDAHASGL
jgi:hypothetical protein